MVPSVRTPLRARVAVRLLRTVLVKPYYDDGSCVVYHDDAFDLPISAGAIVTDPPYGVGVAYDEHDDSPTNYWPQMREAVDLMREIAPVVVFTHRVAALKHLDGWDWVGVWHKPRAMSGLNQLPIMPHWEPVFMYGITGRKDLPRGFDVFTHHSVRADNGHPCPKPASLFSELVQRFVPRGETLLDPFMGSGTTLVAAKSLGVRAIGVEKSERYCEIAAKRLAQEVLPLTA